MTQNIQGKTPKYNKPNEFWEWTGKQQSVGDQITIEIAGGLAISEITFSNNEEYERWARFNNVEVM